MILTRRISQIFFLALFVLLLALMVGRPDLRGSGDLRVLSPLPVDLFLRIDPLAALAAMLGSRTFLIWLAVWTLPVLLLTIVFGRAFCGWVCPLGTCIDAADRCTRSRRDSKTTRERSWPQAKYYLLAALLATALFGAQLVWLLDPIPLLVRGLTLGMWGGLQAAVTGPASLPVIGPAASGLRSLFPEAQVHYRQGLVALGVLVLILCGGLISRRFWCRTLCPLGALLGLVARLPVVRRSIPGECNHCTLCNRDCKMDAIAANGEANSSAECIYCYSCVTLCPRDAAAISTVQPEHVLPMNLSRRHIMLAAAAGAFWALGATSAVARRKTRDATALTSDPRLIRPPGAIAEEEFLERCIRCGACMKACPTNALQPALSEAGPGGLWTPVIVPRVGECTQRCSLCGDVCPTDAIVPFKFEEKEHLYIGRAAINRSTCVVWESGKQCLVCDEVCSYNAIYWKMEGGVKRPFVDSVSCVGCGICENNCPVGGPIAPIRVTCEGDRRSQTRQEQKRWRQANFVDHEEPAPGKPASAN